MLGFRSNWSLTWPEIWRKLSQSSNAPTDLFMALYRCANDYIVNPTAGPEHDTIVNDPLKARRAFRDLDSGRFASEQQATSFLTEAHQTICEFEQPHLTDKYTKLVMEFIERHNLKYRLIEPFELWPLVTGTFARFYSDLVEQVRGHDDLSVLLQAFERSYAHYVRTMHQDDLKKCLANASIFAEGLAAKTLNRPGDTLGASCDRLTFWPHATLKKAVKDLYGFCSDYPGIRHAGNTGGQIRALEPREILITCVLLAFSGYLTQDVKTGVLLGTGT